MAEIVVTQAQNGGRVSIATSDVFTVQLPETPTSGYRWQVDSADGLRSEGAELVSASKTPGASGERRLRFAASTPGMARLELSLRRSWAAGESPKARFAVTIEARAP